MVTSVNPENLDINNVSSFGTPDTFVPETNSIIFNEQIKEILNDFLEESHPYMLNDIYKSKG